LREAEAIVVASVEADKPHIPTLKRPEVKSPRIAAFLSFSLKGEEETRSARRREIRRSTSGGAPTPHLLRWDGHRHPAWLPLS
jgi:hypothetical protein